MATRHKNKIGSWIFSSTLLASLLVFLILDTGSFRSIEPTLVQEKSYTKGALHAQNFTHATTHIEQSVHTALLKRDVIFDQRIVKGRSLMCLMKAQTNAAADALLTSGTAASHFTQYADFVRWGWEHFDLRGNTPDLGGPDFDTQYQAFGITRANNWFDGYGHFFNWDDSNGIEHPETGGVYQNLVNCPDGAIIAIDNKSPRWVALDGATTFPELEQWSDVVFLQYQEFCGPLNIRSLRHFLRVNIANDDTKRMIIAAFRLTGGNTVPAWPGKTFRIDPATMKEPLTNNEPSEFLGLLGSKNGAGGAFVLFQHKAALGIKVITSIQVWATGSSNWAIDERDFKYISFNMHLGVEDYP